MENRMTEIYDNFQSFKKELFSKKELLPELFALQDEIVNLTFNKLHAENGKLRIYEVEKHFRQLNDECGGIATAELERFESECKDFCNLIRAEVSGNHGERQAFRALETLRCKNRILKNIELNAGDHRTELDAVVLTEKAVFLIEVKNTQKDIYIGENGNYYRVVNGERVLSKFLGEKMNEKEYLLREVLKQAGIENANIINLVVFTNGQVGVENHYPYINICYLSNLPHKIREVQGSKIYSDSMVEKMVSALEANRCRETYPIEFNVQSFKRNFAALMAKLEKAKKEKANAEESGEEKTEPVTCKISPLAEFKKYKKIGGIAAAFVIATVATGIAVATHFKKK